MFLAVQISRAMQTTTGDSRWETWGRFVLALASLGVFVSVAIFAMVRSRETQIAREEFRLASNAYEFAVRREIESNLAALRTLRAYVEVTPDLEDSGFATFAAEAVRANPSILSLEWAPRIAGPDRAAFEAELAKRDVHPPFIRRSRTADPQRAAARPEYYPIAFIYPHDYADRITGYDAATLVATRRLLTDAAATGEVVVGGQITVVERTFNGFGLPSYLAVYRGPREQRVMRGYALAVFQMGEVLERGLERLKREPVDIQFYDLSAAPGKRFLYRHRWSTGVDGVQYGSEAEALREHDFKHIVQFDVGSRHWAMLMTATEDYSAARRTWQPWGVLGIGLSLTGLAAGLFVLHTKHARKDEELRHLRSRKEAQEALRESEERYALAARGSKDGLWDWDLLTGKVFYSERWKSMLGFSDADIDDSPAEWLGRLYPGERERLELELAQHCTGRTDHFQSEYRILHRDGTYRWMLSRGVAVLNAGGEATRVAGSQTDITANRSADHLTGLASRILLNEKLQLSIDHARTHTGELFAVLFLDLDRFKVINDSLGHLAGDRLLLEIARRLTDCVALQPFSSARITVARLGGDEFVVLIRGMSDTEVAIALANQIQEVMKPAFELHGHQVFVSASIGVKLGDANATPESLLRDADTAMYHAKSSGKQRYEVFVPAMRFRAVERLRMETDLRNAIEKDSLSLYYQPKVCLVTGIVAEVEALVRWDHPERGMIGPAEFIPLADETGLIEPLGEWVLRKACAQMAAWLVSYDLDPRMRVSVNLSCRQFAQPELLDQILGILHQTGLPPERLSLEITEGVLMENMESAGILLKKLRDQKIGLQIDDFGTGYSSLNYLHRLPFDALKIDRSFVEEMGVRGENAQIVSTIIVLARTLGMGVVAEGVETEQQLFQLLKFGCDYAQGHLFSAAVNAEAAACLFGGFARFLDRSMPAAERERVNLER